MTTAITRDPRFGQITGFAGPNASPLVALCGRKVLIAEKSGDRVSLLGQSPDLGGTVLAADNSTAGEIHILTSAGYVRTNDADIPAVLSVLSFDPGNGKWLFRYGNYLVAPCVDGGVQAFHKTTGTIVNKIRTGLSSSRFGAGNSSLGYLWVVDETRAKIAGYTVSSTGILTFAGTVNAPNCRNVIKVVVDATQGNLFVVCKNRIVRFTIPTTAVGIDSMLPVFAEDYGTRSLEYTDFVVVAPNSYWIGRKSEDDGYPLAYDLGPVYGVWDGSLGDNGELLVAAPKMSAWNVTNVVPTFDEDTGGGDGGGDSGTPPEVIVPDPPVITSPDTAEVTEGELWEYTITATGTGPITYSIVSKPSWLTPAGTVSGYFSGTQFTVGTYEITVSATNAGGTTTQVVTLTVINAVYNNLTGISTNSSVNDFVRVDNRIYFVGGFTTVTDRNGTYTRNRAACLDLSTGLWTAWDPNCSGTVRCVAAASGSTVYLALNGAATVGGQARGYLAEVDTNTGAVSPFNPTINGVLNQLVFAEGRLYAFGSFTLVEGQTRWAACAFVANSLTGFRIYDATNGWDLVQTLNTSQPGTISSVGVSGGVVHYAGAFTMPRTAGGSVQRNFGTCDAVTGFPTQMSMGDAAVSTGAGFTKGMDRDGVFRYATTFGSLSAITLPVSGGTLWTGKFGVLVAGATALSGVSQTCLPTFTGSPLRFFVRRDDGGYIFGGQGIQNINGDANRKTLAAVDANGATDTGFTFSARGNVAFQGTNPLVNVARIEQLGVTQLFVVGGTYGNVSTQTYDGTPVNNLLFLNPVTGARL